MEINKDKKPIQNYIDSVRFDLYNSDFIRKISVKSITEPLAYDNLNRPVRGGLHDPAMGVSAYDKISK
jgi:DNA-directed RNA polymerase I subunit RPA1